MPVPVTENLIALLKFNHDVIHEQLKDISHTESLLQLPPETAELSCRASRHNTGRQSDSAWYAGYYQIEQASMDMVLNISGSSGKHLDDLLKKLDGSFKLLTGSLEKLSQSDADRQVEIWRGPMPLWRALGFMFWHESYHTGQLEQLRQLAGKNDHVF
jgi:hypothetical protein